LRWLTSWQSDRVATAVVVGAALLYGAGVRATARRGRRRGYRAWPWRWTACFVAGLGACLLATTSSMAVYDMSLFSAHMLGHLMLVMVGPPLLAAGRPLTLLLHATGNPAHTRIKRLLRSRVVSLWFSPLVALAAYAVVIVGTHLTGLMDQIMTRPWAGQVEHLAYVLVGYQFFTVAFGAEPIRWRLSMPARQLLLALAMGVDTFTGVVLLQSSQPIAMGGGTPLHVNILDDTHLGGAIMWVGGDGIMAVVMMLIALEWLHRPEYRRTTSRSWLERARRDALDQSEATDVDSDEQALDAYNERLRRMAGL